MGFQLVKNGPALFQTVMPKI